MELYLLRHGIAADRGADQFRNDSHRPLTPGGMKKTRKVARAFKALNLKFDLVLTSPYVRAKQTADIVVEELEIHHRLRLCPALAPGGKPRELVEELKRLSRSGSQVLLVGHEPGMSSLASLLISGSPKSDLTLKKAGLCRLDTGDLVAGACASLEWLLPPRLLLHLTQ